MKFADPNTTPTDMMSSLEHWILVHSEIYYSMDMNIVPDNMYDMNCKQLADLMTQYPKEFKKSKYAYAFKDFDGSTGSDLMYKLNDDDNIHIVSKAKYLVEMWNKEWNKKEPKSE